MKRKADLSVQVLDRLREKELISVLMGVCNGAATLKKAVDSILAQTYQNFEFIICDDASTDETWPILEIYSAQDKRIRIMKNPQNLGLGASLNNCLAIAEGDYIARQDADDISEPERLERTLQFLKETGSPYVGCGILVFDDKGVWNRRCYPQVITRHIIAQKNPFFHPTMLFRREVIKGAGGYRVAKETRRTEDYDLVMRLAGMGLIGQNLQQYLYQFYEPEDAYLRHTKKTRWYEIKVRLYGLRAMDAPLWDYLYLVKPVVMSLVPRRFIRVVKELQWGKSKLD